MPYMGEGIASNNMYAIYRHSIGSGLILPQMLVLHTFLYHIGTVALSTLIT